MEILFNRNDEPIPGYIIQDLISHGGIGIVYRATHETEGLVALKYIPDETRQELERAGLELVRPLKHPHLLEVRDQIEHESGLFVIMECADCTFEPYLRAAKKGQPTMSPFTLMRHMTGIAAAVDYLGQHKIVHCDVKPGNMLLVDNVAKLGDFSLTMHLRHTAVTVFGYTPHYSSPEVLNDGESFATSDQFALASCWFEFLTGQLPFPLVFDREKQGEIKISQRPSLELLDERLRPIFQQALAPIPDDRFPSCEEFVKQVAATGAICDDASSTTNIEPAIRVDEQSSHDSTKRPESAAKRRRLKRLALAAATLLVVTILVAVSWRPMQRRPAHRDNEMVDGNPKADIPSRPQPRSIVVFFENFDDEFFSNDKLEFPPEVNNRGVVIEKGGYLQLVNRGYLIVRKSFPYPIGVRFKWRWLQKARNPLYADTLTVALRTSGQPCEHHAFETKDGLQLTFSAVGGNVGLTRANPVTQKRFEVPAQIQADDLRLAAGHWYTIYVTDDLHTICAYIKGKNIPAKYWRNPALRADWRKEYVHHRIAIYNREYLAGHEHISQIDDLTVTKLTSNSGPRIE